MGAVHMPDVLFDKSGHTAILTFHRPEKLNALSYALIDEFLRLLDVVEADPALRAIVLTGSGRAFSAGADIPEFAQSVGGMVDWGGIGTPRKQLSILGDICASVKQFLVMESKTEYQQTIQSAAPVTRLDCEIPESDPATICLHQELPQKLHLPGTLGPAHSDECGICIGNQLVSIS